ncbi:MAG: hypothetical protein HYS26_01965 [Candidatus Kaiserbacteria bacterium]|nr:MAG: hypothetical protein HYS26_01965 [Candidatus Kaiserbacteria bacterium]
MHEDFFVGARYFTPGGVYRVFHVDKNGVWIGPKNAPDLDIEEFTPEKGQEVNREKRYRTVLWVDRDVLEPLH